MDLLHPLWAEINIDNFLYNIDQIKSKLNGSEIIGVVKANSYGHGSVLMSKLLIESKVKRLAVANVIEAIELRENNIDVPIITLGIVEDYAIDSLLKYDIEPTVSSYNFCENLNKKAKELNKKVNIHIAIDSGMGRIGFRESIDSLEDIVKISKLSNLNIESIASHFSTSDSSDKSYSKKQIDRYHSFLNKLNERGVKLNKKNFSNSAAIMDLPDAHYDFVRPGIVLYGYYPSDEVNKDNLDIKPVLTWKTRIIHIKEVETNESIGYNQTFKTKRKTTIATLPVGYADGYNRGLSNKGYVIIKGQMAPVIGNVCMDQIMIDITDLKDIALGDEVILLGSDGNVKFDADDMAKILNTISYEVLCLIGRRTPRVYIKDNEILNIKYFI